VYMCVFVLMVAFTVGGGPNPSRQGRGTRPPSDFCPVRDAMLELIHMYRLLL